MTHRSYSFSWPVIFILALACVTLASHARTTVRAQSSQNPVQVENAKPGTTDWKLTNPGWTSGVIEAYADVTSVNHGGQIRFFVNTSDPTYSIEIFRIGYETALRTAVHTLMSSAGSRGGWIL